MQTGSGSVILQVSPSHVYPGEGATLSWVSDPGCTFSSSNFGAYTTSGSTGVYPGSTRTYQISVDCLGAGTSTAYATVSVH